MKRSLWILISIACIWVSLWQTFANPDNTFTTWEQTKIVTQDIKWATINDLNFLWMRFCNNWLESRKLTNQLELQIQPGQKKDICLVFFNVSPDKPLDVKFWFSATNIDEKWKISCDDDMTTKNDFSKLIDQTGNTWFIIPPNGKVLKKLKMYISKTYTGNTMYWCLAYKMNKEEAMDPWQMFLFVYRKTAPMAITITGNPYRFWRRDDLKDTYTSNRNIVLKTIIALLGLWIVVSIIQTAKKKKKHHHNKK